MILATSDQTDPKRWIVDQGLTVLGPEKTATMSLKTGEITDVNTVSNVYSSTVSASNGYTENRGPEKGFDGRTQATGSPTYCQTDTNGGSVTWTATSFNIDTSSSNVVIWAISSSDQITVTGSGGSQTFAAGNNTTGNNIPDCVIVTGKHLNQSL